MISPGYKRSYKVGLPIDMQLDNVAITDWGIEGMKTPPAWIKLNEEFSDGLVVVLDPKVTNIGIYIVFIDLIDDNEKPMSSRFNFEIQIIDTSNLDFLKKNSKREEKKQYIIEEAITVKIFPPDEIQNFKVFFSRDIALPTNSS